MTISTYTDAGSWRAWAGTTDRVRRIADIVDAAFAEDAAQALGRAASEREKELADIDAATYSDQLKNDRRDRAETDYTEIVDVIEREYVPSAEALTDELNGNHRGPVDDVLAIIEPRAVVSLTVTAPKRSYRIDKYTTHPDRSVRVSYSRSRGCSYEVRGEDQAWVRGVSSQIDSELRKDVPKWAVLRQERMYWLTVAVTFGIGLLYLALNPAGAEMLELNPVSVGLALAVIAHIPALALMLLVRRLVPSFELLPPGEQPKIATATGGLIIGIVASLIATGIIALVAAMTPG